MSNAGVFERVPATHRQWIFINSVLITAFINIAINVGLAAASAHGDHIAWWTTNPFKTNLLYNSLGTLFFLPLLTTVGVNYSVSKERLAGTLAPIEAPFAGRLWRWICVSAVWKRGLRFGVVTLGVLAPLDILAVVLLGRDGASASHFVMVQTLVAVLLGAVVTPLTALAAMCDKAGTAA